MNNYGVWLSFNNQAEGFQIPVNPDKMEFTENGKGKTYDVLQLGEINTIKDRKLTEITFSSIFPFRNYPFVISKRLLTPKSYIDYINKWRDTNHPIRFIFISPNLEVNLPVSIEAFSWAESANRNKDITYTMKLKEYKFYSAKQVTPVAPADIPTADTTLQVEKEERPDDRQTPQTHTLMRDESLWIIAKKKLNNPNRWREIQTLNNIPDSQLKSLQVGMVLRLPEIERRA